MKKQFIMILLLIGLLIISFNNHAQPLKHYDTNPYYWEYFGEPLLLIGGSKDDNLFQVTELEEHLDLLQEVGGNYIRNSMSDRKDNGNEVYAYKKLNNGKYDLNQWNEEYWTRFKQLLELTAERDIIVQIELWDQWDFNSGRWDNNPWNPNQNINYTTSNTRLKGDGHYEGVNARLGQSGNITVKDTAKYGGQMDFFLTVPVLNNDTKVLSYQQQFIDKVLSYTLNYDHVLYTITNELFMQHPSSWSIYWARYIRDKAEKQGKVIHVTEMLHNHNIRDKQHKVTFDQPNLFSFVDISQNSLEDLEDHWESLQWLHQYIENNPRPINHVKTYGSAGHSIPRFWNNLIGGAASCRFHRPNSGIGLNEDALTQLKSMRMWLSEYNIFTSKPDSKHKLLNNREKEEAYACYRENQQYTVYFPNGGDVDLQVPQGKYQVKWLNINNCKWEKGSNTKKVKEINLVSPGNGYWLALITIIN